MNLFPRILRAPWLECVLVIGLLAFSLNEAGGQVVEAWVQRYSREAETDNEAYAVVVDHEGSVVVAGITDTVTTRPDIVLIKYSNTGVPLWTNLYSGPGDNEDFVSDLAVTTNGTVILAGTTQAGGTDYLLLAYSSAGVPLWTNCYDGGPQDEARAVAIAESGNVFVTGRSVGFGTSWDYVTIAYSTAGVPLWTNRYIGPGEPGLNYDDANDIAVDKNGNVFVTGASTQESDSDEDYVTVAYSSAGVPLWTNIYNGPASSTDRAMSVAVDTSGHVFVTGDSTGIGGVGYATIAYSGDGVPLWTNRYHAANSLDYAKAVAVDGNGRVFVTGSSSGLGGDDGDYVTIAYLASTGTPLWTNRYDGPGHSQDEAMAIVASGNGQVVVTGYSAAENLFGFPHNHDYATVAYDASGATLWTTRYAGTANGFDAPRSKTSLAVDGAGAVFVTGMGTEVSSDSAGYRVEFVTVKYVPVTLEIRKQGDDVVLSWPVAGFGLQSAPTLTDVFTNVSGAVSPFTNSIAGEQLYFRLKSNQLGSRH